MADDDKSKQFPDEYERDDDESGKAGSTGAAGGDTGESGTGEAGGAQGQIEFHDFLAPGISEREDLSYDEERRLLSIHKDSHEWHVKKQKDLREARKALREGKKTYQQFREQGYGRGGTGNMPNHPILANKAQFSGIDKQESPMPNENVAETNPGDRNELEMQYRLTHTPEFTARPRFNPKPQR